MNIAVSRRDLLQKFDCLICNQIEAGVSAGLTYGKTLGQAVEIGTRLAASVITSSENVCPRFLPEEFGIQA